MSKISKLLLMIIFMVVAAGMVGCGQDEAPEKAVVRPVRAVRVADSTRLHKRTFPGRLGGATPPEARQPSATGARRGDRPATGLVL